MHKNATKCNETLSKWCKNKHGASKIIDTFETYHRAGKREVSMQSMVVEADDVVGYEDDDARDEGMVDEDVEGGETSGDKEWSCWTPRHRGSRRDLRRPEEAMQVT
jgi:hypothetical protein